MSFARESDRHGEFLTALRYPALTPFFDPVVRVLFREREVKARLVAGAALRPGQRAVDVGCGTGTLAILLKQSAPDATVFGLDGDPAALAIARRKAARANADIRWDAGMAQSLPYPDGSFDVVSSTLVLHHLTHEDRIATIREAYRVLCPGGALHVVEFTRPRGRLMFALAKISELLERTEDGVEGRLPGIFRAAGFNPVEEVDAFATPLGTIALFRALKPSRRTGPGSPAPQSSLPGVLLYSRHAHAPEDRGSAPGGSIMGVEENKAIVRMFYDEVMNRGNLSVIDKTTAENFVDHSPMPDQAPGLEGVKQGFRMMREAFPDGLTTIDDLIAEGDKVVVLGTMTGTHQGSFMGIPATGRAVKISGIDVVRFEGGQVVEHWGQWDTAALMQQLGLAPPPPGRSETE